MVGCQIINYILTAYYIGILSTMSEVLSNSISGSSLNWSKPCMTAVVSGVCALMRSIILYSHLVQLAGIVPVTRMAVPSPRYGRG